MGAASRPRYSCGAWSTRSTKSTKSTKSTRSSGGPGSPSSAPSTHAGLRAALQLLLALHACTSRAEGGICWASMDRNGHCTELTAERVTREECCAASQPPAAAWSNEDLDPGALFFWRVLGGGVPCHGCRETCLGVQCGSGRRCVLRGGRPRCVCAPRCGGALRPGPVCGTDGRSYRSLCRLRKRACRRRARDLQLDYYGHCQSSCANIRCDEGRHCLMDQDERAHCVRCARRCEARGAARALCGADGRTYSSACHLRAAACRKGRSIPIAYHGPCTSGASCGSVRCRSGQACLAQRPSGAPRCVTCGARCPRSRRTLCGSNNRTYPSWCHMLRDSCSTGFIIDTRHAGSCGASTSTSTSTSIVNMSDASVSDGETETEEEDTVAPT